MTTNDFITCRELIDFIADYLDDRLDRDQRHDFERHLSVCPSCVNYLDAYKKTIALGKQALAPTDEPARGVAPEGLIKAIKSARRNLKV